MPATSKRLLNFGESVIREMTRVSNRNEAINLSQGFPDFDPPEELLKALEIALRGPCHQYAITWGSPNFRAALAAKITHFSGIQVDPETELVVTCGSTEAMMVAMMTACNPGEKVVVFSPFYENYAADAILSGAEPIHITLQPPDFIFDREQLRKVFELSHPKAIVLCNPSNPCGRVFKREELEFLSELAIEHDAFVITDEVYEHIVYDPNQHISIATLPEMQQRTLTCNSLSKTYSITGWRLGYVWAPATVISQARKVHDFLTVGAAAPLQEAAVTALRFPDIYYEKLLHDYTERRDLFCSYLERTHLQFYRPEGAYYVLVDISPLGYTSDRECAEWLSREIGVTGVPGSAFFHESENRFIRFHFAKKLETLQEAGEKLISKL
jgi:aspartate/methionine/tyrosine aminotransferase